MRQGKCEQCGLTGALGSFKFANEKLYCGRCAQQLADQAKASRQSLEFASVIDPTVCNQCKADNGYQEFPPIGNLPFCPRCAAALYERPYPAWLKLSLAGLLLLLGFGLVRSVPFFRAGKALVRGERLVDARRYPEAIAPLQVTLAVAPNCEKAVLLLAKADLLSGRFNEANKVLTSHNEGRFKEEPLTGEVRQIYQRASKAVEKNNKAGKLYEQKKFDEAAREMREAAQLYPESPALPYAADNFDGAAAFEHKDYDRFLEIAERGWKGHPDSADYAGMLASALACKYAVTGAQAFRTRCEEMLNAARRLSESSPQAKETEKEYEERIRQRLQSRKIIEREEYDRRFRKKKTQP